MDEIGRGTSTFDGLALASSIATHLHDKTRAFTLFATHYFELTEFRPSTARRRTGTSRPPESGTTSSSCTRSGRARQPQLWRAGGALGRHAGQPDPPGARDAGSTRNHSAAGDEQFDFFAAPPAPPPLELPARPHSNGAVSARPDALTPRGALDALYRLKALAR